jgi:hypothetical protein
VLHFAQSILQFAQAQLSERAKAFNKGGGTPTVRKVVPLVMPVGWDSKLVLVG